MTPSRSSPTRPDSSTKVTSRGRSNNSLEQRPWLTAVTPGDDPQPWRISGSCTYQVSRLVSARPAHGGTHRRRPPGWHGLLLRWVPALGLGDSRARSNSSRAFVAFTIIG